MKNWLKQARAAGVPLVLVETFDAAQTIKSAILSLNGKAKDVAFLQHDFANGLVGLVPQTVAPVDGQKGILLAQNIGAEPMATQNPFEALTLIARNEVNEAVFFFHCAQEIFAQAVTVQAVWNLRDKFKSNGCVLVLLTPGCKIPDALKYDLLIINEPLPKKAEIRKIVDSICVAAGLTEKDDVKELASNSLLGLTTFAAEQALSLSIEKTGIDLQVLAIQRRAFINKTDGIEIREDKTTFAEIAGYEPIKERIWREIKGKYPPTLILWLDEVREAFAGVNGLDGTTADQVGCLQTWIQDKLNANKFLGMFAVGFPGTSKSMLAAALRNEAGCECIRLDMGAMKGSLVGESERKIRAVLKTIDALTSGNILAFATCNGIKGIPAPFISRFSGGIYMFDTPNPEERASLWQIKRAKFNIPETDLEPKSDGWTGREVHQCCSNADRLGVSLLDAARDISPYCLSNKMEIDELRNHAAGKWLSASNRGLYVKPSLETGRKLGDF